MAATDTSLPGLLTPSLAYKPFRYPWAYDFWKKQQQVHWMPEEVPLGEDCKDWAVKLSDEERNLLTQIFRFFTQSDVEVGANYMTNYMPRFKPVEVSMMLSAFSNMETIHIAAYALLLETIGMPDTEFSAFMEYQEMAAKHDYLGQDQDGNVRLRLDDVLRSRNAIHHRHHDVHQDNVRPRLRCKANCFFAVTCFTNHNHVRFGIHQGRDAKPQHRMIVHHHHTDLGQRSTPLSTGAVFKDGPNRSGKFLLEIITPSSRPQHDICHFDGQLSPNASLVPIDKYINLP